MRKKTTRIRTYDGVDYETKINQDIPASMWIKLAFVGIVIGFAIAAVLTFVF